MSLKLQAARALALSQPLTVPALFLLMQIGSVPKGTRSRVFHVRWLRTPTTLVPLRRRGISLDEALTELAKAGMIRRVGRSHIVCTAEGDLTKHCYNDLLAEADVQGAISRVAPDKMARTASLRLVMQLYVAGRSWAAIKREIAAAR